MEYKLSVVGQSEYDRELSQVVLPIFFVSEVSLYCSFTKKGKLTLGWNGPGNVVLKGFKHCHSKDALITALWNKGDSITDYIHWRSWFNMSNIKFTDALINNIFKAITATKLWVKY